VEAIARAAASCLAASQSSLRMRLAAALSSLLAVRLFDIGYADSLTPVL